MGRGIRVSVAGADWEPNLHVQARTGRGTTLAARATAALSRVLVRPATLAGVVSVDLAARTLDGVTVPASVSLLRQALPFGLVGWLAGWALFYIVVYRAAPLVFPAAVREWTERDGFRHLTALSTSVRRLRRGRVHRLVPPPRPSSIRSRSGQRR